jgi:ABC-type spermidine/putrescine transport system permease subunit II
MEAGAVTTEPMQARSTAEAMLLALVIYLVVMYLVVPLMAVAIYTLQGGEWTNSSQYCRLSDWHWVCQ